MFRFPWGDMHSLNLGWFLQKFNDLREDWATAEENITGALDAEIQRAEDALSDVFDARDAAAASATAAAGSATAAGTSATAAQNSATAAASSATLANNKATAAGLSEAAAAQSATQAGNRATAAAGSATQAGQSATSASGSATAAGNSATTAAGSATAAASSATQAGNSATAANADKLISEGYAVGEQNGSPVGPDSPYYQNNAKYYAGQGGGAGEVWNEAVLDATDFDTTLNSFLFDAGANKKIREARFYGQIVYANGLGSYNIKVGIGNTTGNDTQSIPASSGDLSATAPRLVFGGWLFNMELTTSGNRIALADFIHGTSNAATSSLTSGAYGSVPAATRRVTAPNPNNTNPRYLKIETGHTAAPDFAFIKILYKTV